MMIMREINKGSSCFVDFVRLKKQQQPKQRAAQSQTLSFKLWHHDCNLMRHAAKTILVEWLEQTKQKSAN